MDRFCMGVPHVSHIHQCDIFSLFTLPNVWQLCCPLDVSKCARYSFLYTTKDDNKLWLSQYHIVHNNHAKTLISFSVFTSCDEWGGAESRGNGVRPVE